MLEHIFSSITRVKILYKIYQNPKKIFFVRELARDTNSQLNSVRRELSNLEKVGIIVSLDSKDARIMKGEGRTDKKNEKTSPPHIEKMKKYYAVNLHFLLFHELRSLILKSRIFAERSFIKKIEGIAKVQFLILTGVFIGIENCPTDLLLIGNAEKKKLMHIIHEFEKELNQKINYTIMSLAEYKYRKEITDRFLYDILENKHIVVIDRISDMK